MKQTLTQRIEAIENRVKDIEFEIDIDGRDTYPDEPSTAMRSTGELTKKQLDIMQTQINIARGIKPYKPQEDVRNQIIKLLLEHTTFNDIPTTSIADRILAIVKGE